LDSRPSEKHGPGAPGSAPAPKGLQRECGLLPQPRNRYQRLEARVVNYADDFVILCRGTAAETLTVTRRWMENLKLTLNEKKTCLRDARRESFDFLGYTFWTQRASANGTHLLGGTAVEEGGGPIAGSRARDSPAGQSGSLGRGGGAGQPSFDGLAQLLQLRARDARLLAGGCLPPAPGARLSGAAA
jgi:Reverse transcriptase (RNA-dependent DNA polymerase)